MSSAPAPDTTRLHSALSELAARIESEFQIELERCTDSARRAAAELFNRAARRLGAEEDWAAALLDAAADFAPRTAVLAVRGESLRLLRARGTSNFPAGARDSAPFGRGSATDSEPRPQGAVPRESLQVGADPPDIPLSEGAALAGAVQSRDTVVALRAPGEVPGTLARLFAGQPGERCYVLPVVDRGRVTALLYAEGEDVDVNALEALAALAGPASARRAKAELLSRDEEAVHLRAQHFARVRVAEMRLYRDQAVRSGRGGKALYRELRNEIESAREAYRREFLPAASNMVDYLHQELVRTLANEDAAVLGDDYPGPLA